VNQTRHCCEAQFPPVGGFTEAGERWDCPTCGTRWIHVVEESEGCWWERVEEDQEDDPEAA